MITKKICMLGAFSVGKTSLVRRYVYSLFDEKYQTTIGVQISKKDIVVGDSPVKLMVWDIEGADEFTEIRTSYLRGAAGCFLIVDGTRPNTAETIDELHKIMVEQLGADIPFVLLINKADLEDRWTISESHKLQWEMNNWSVMKTSAKTGNNVDEAFQLLAEKMVKVT